MGNIDKRALWLFGEKTNILKDKQQLINSYMGYMFNKTLEMFEYEYLPETIPVRELELILQVCRFAIFTKKDDHLFVFYGGLGGQPNMYYQPTQAIVSNPYLQFSDVLKLDDYIINNGDAVVGWNDSMHMGLYPLNNRYASLLAETDLTLKYHLVNLRFNNVFTADNDNVKESLETMYKNVEEGTGYGIIVTKTFMEETNVGKIETKQSTNAPLKDIIETKQYLLGSWYNEVGLNANYNMKREAINESEESLNEDALLPLPDNMLKQRKLMCEQINKKFGTNINVKFNSAWLKKRKEMQLIEKENVDVLKGNDEENEN